MKSVKLSYILLVVFINVMSAQNKLTDSLISVLNKTVVDSQKVKLYGDISWEFMSSDINQSLLYAEKELELAVKINSEKDVAQAESDIGSIYNRKGDFSSALMHYNKALVIRQKLKQPIKIAGIYTNIATVLMRQNKQKESLEINFKTLKIFEELKDENKQALVLGNIGNLYFNLKQNKEATVFFIKALALAKKTNNKTCEANVCVNIADVKYEAKDYSSAEYYFRQALVIYNQTNDLFSSAAVYNNLGNLCAIKNDSKNALLNYDLSLKNRILLEDSFGIAQSHLQIGEFYGNQYQFAEAIGHFKIAEKIYLKENALMKLESTYKSLAKSYENKGNTTDAIKYYKLYSEVKDSIYVKELSNQLVEMNTKYETDKKEQQNVILSTQNKLSNETIKEQKIVTYFIITALLLLAGLAFFIYKGLKNQRHANRIISIQKQQVEVKNHIIEEKQKEIVDSINYAKRIQYALLAHQDFVNKFLPNNFILFKPKDIVSGDFYWATEHNNKFYLAVCDCTGHGVPGAFMSLLNIGFLSEAIKENDIEEPGEIFNYVRKRLINSISNDQQKDGMDGILLCLDKTTKKITYTASNNEPILISNNEIIELQKDKMPVGKGEKTNSFTTHTVIANEGDMLYLYTDGYADQFGGPKGKKLKYKTLNELLLKNIAKPMNEQAEILNIEFENWRGNLEQVDDVCIVGIKL